MKIIINFHNRFPTEPFLLCSLVGAADSRQPHVETKPLVASAAQALNYENNVGTM